MVEQVDDGILISKSRLIRKLDGVQEWLDSVLELLQDELLDGLYGVGGQCHGS